MRKLDLYSVPHDKRSDWVPGFTEPPFQTKARRLVKGLAWKTAKEELLRRYIAYDQENRGGPEGQLDQLIRQRPKDSRAVDEWLTDHRFYFSQLDPEGFQTSKARSKDFSSCLPDWAIIGAIRDGDPEAVISRMQYEEIWNKFRDYIKPRLMCWPSSLSVAHPFD